ncbi:MAG: peptide chain release factor-like protein [Akkermansia sp.]|nr:peptide chain release factor-like protein [Akkermansia sp.]MBR3696068.1 peptide chain release factor-like protein [Akkermansia sp.]
MAVSLQKRNELAERMKMLGVLERDLEETFVRGSGKGGQKVNKTNNCVCLVHRPTGLVIKCHREREREINRFLARRALCDELDHRINGAPSPKQMEAIRARKRGSLLKNISIVQRKRMVD